MSLKLGLVIVININLTIHCGVSTSAVGCVMCSLFFYIGIRRYCTRQSVIWNLQQRLQQPWQPPSSHGTPVPLLRQKTISQDTAQQVCVFKTRKNIIIDIFMAILVTTLCERADNHGGRRRPAATLWPHSRRRGTLQTAYILRNKFTLVNLENIIVIYTIMTFKGMTCCAWHLAIWSQTFELDNLAIARYLVDIDQWSLRV